MKMSKKIFSIAFGGLILCTLAACAAMNNGVGYQIALKHTESPQKHFADIASGIRLEVRNEAPAVPAKAIFSPSVESFVRESAKKYMRQMGFHIDMNAATDYTMVITVNQFETHNTGMDITVYDPSHREVFSTAANAYKATFNFYNAPFAKALNEIDWESIAHLVQRRKLPAREQTAQVQGFGTTALEHTILNWEVTSRPAGADLYWRVLSSTPDVKNTNKNYKATTPYESTESFDIRGLTYQNSGDVQIELTCEKPGYLTQKKVFNVRMCIDQKSINAHFTLVKDE